MNCPKRIEVALAFARKFNRFPWRLFVKPLCILHKGLEAEHQGSGLDKGGTKEVKSLETKPLLTPESGPKPRDLQARTSLLILVEKTKGPAEGKKAKRQKSKTSKSSPFPKQQPR